MFGKNKKQKELERTLADIKLEKELLEKEKEQLLKIKQMMENTNNHDVIDISDVYVWIENGIHCLVRLAVENITGENKYGTIINEYKSTLTDIFTGKVIYEKNSTEKIDDLEKIDYNGRTRLASFMNIFNVERELLIYIDKQVPKYILQQLFYRLNNIDISESKYQKYIGN